MRTCFHLKIVYEFGSELTKRHERHLTFAKINYLWGDFSDFSFWLRIFCLSIIKPYQCLYSTLKVNLTIIFDTNSFSTIFLNYPDRLRAVCHIFPISTYQKVTCQKSANGFVFKNGIVHKCLYRFQCVEIFVQSSYFSFEVFAKLRDARRPQYLSHKYFWKTFTGVCLTGVAMYWLYNFRAKID